MNVTKIHFLLREKESHEKGKELKSKREQTLINMRKRTKKRVLKRKRQ
jgi:hypothetical protein